MLFSFRSSSHRLHSSRAHLSRCSMMDSSELRKWLLIQLVSGISMFHDQWSWKTTIVEPHTSQFIRRQSPTCDYKLMLGKAGPVTGVDSGIGRSAHATSLHQRPLLSSECEWRIHIF
ncbi:hypothetical protein D5086_024370 [Populus alba]|uniref:Uncharacterized protein n=1 Tax=Populus alba TaxID=43335 RepID=A0ACC4B6T6_POPAL